MFDFQRGDVDGYVQMVPSHAERALEDSTLQVWSFPIPSIFFIAWNGRVPKLSDARVRRALTMGIDRRTLIDGYQAGAAVLLNSGVPPFHFAYDPTLEEALAYDPQRAGALLDEVGWVDRDGDGVRENA